MATGKRDDEPTTGQRVHAEAFDAFGATLDHSSGQAAAQPDGTLDLPVSDQVASGGDLDPGKAIGHFVIRKRLGEGGMGVVLEGHDADLGRPVAIKVVKESANHPAYRERLLREARVMARLEHPNVVRVYEVGSERGRLFVAMELVDGVNLSTWLKVQRRSWREIVAMFEQVGRGLAAVHAAGLVHRDFKPDNVLVDRDGRARVADFGLARVDPDRGTITPELAASLTRTGMMVGTPAYMAPEQHFGGNVDARADQYSFAVALREALIGSRPTKIEDAHWGEVPRGMRAAIDRGAKVDVDERFATMDELLAAIARGSNRRALYLGVAAAAVVLVGGGIAGFMIMQGNDKPTQIARAPAPPPTPVVENAPDPAAPKPSPYETQPVDKSPVDKSPADKPIEKTVERPAPKTPDKPIDKSAPAKPADKSGPAKVEKTSTSTTNIGGTVITPMEPVKETAEAKKHNLEGDNPKHEMIAGHRAVVRDVLEDFGFGGITITGNDRDADFKELEAKLAASTDVLEQGVFEYALGQTERLRGSCGAAAKHWSTGRKLVLEATKGPLDSEQKQKRRNQAFQFYGRIVIAEAFCELLNGKALGIDEKLLNGLRNLFGSGDPERSEAWFALGIVYTETGDLEQGKQLLLQAGRRGNSDKLRAAIEKYAAAVGVKF